jgi:outer membrane protein OmpA-like peptidoglycan-associated protein
MNWLTNWWGSFQHPSPKANRGATHIGKLTLGVCSLLAASTLGEKAAQAQDAGAFYLDRAQLSGAPDDPFMTWRPVFHEKARFYGTGSLGYSLNPLRISTLTNNQAAINDGENPFRNQLILYLQGGLQINSRVALEISQPIALISSGGRDPKEQGFNIGTGFARGAAMHDTRISLRALAIESDDKKFRWGAGGALFVPTGNAVRFSSDDQLGVWLFTNLEYNFGDFMWVGMVGPHFRKTQGPRPSTLQVGNELRLSTGIFFPFQDQRLTIGAEIWGQTGISEVKDTETDKTSNAFFRSENTSFEWLAQGRLAMGDQKSWFIQAGAGTRFTGGYGAADLRILASVGSSILLADVGPSSPPPKLKASNKVSLAPDPDMDGDGFPDAIDQCPTVKEDGKPPFTDDGCPDLDQDDDGILDKDDKCVTIPEDKDGVEDEDGCPEDDADHDGILDADDACPLVKGVKNPDPKKNGCPPEKKRIVVETNEVKLLEPIQFEYNKATILSVSFPILDEIVDLMRERPMLRLGIYGHTDNRGGAAYNKNLSDRRAHSVVQYIRGKEIAQDRLESAGYGMERPVDSNDSDEGRAKNRRVEFKILAQ